MHKVIINFTRDKCLIIFITVDIKERTINY